MFDCGEGTQRQMMRYGTGFALHDIFFTHMHADHFLGVIGLLRTMGLQGREEPMRLCGSGGRRGDPARGRAPRRGARALRNRDHRARSRSSASRAMATTSSPFKRSHGIRSLGFALVEHERLGRFNLERRARWAFRKARCSASCTAASPSKSMAERSCQRMSSGPPRPGRRIVYTGDTRPCRATSRSRGRRTC